MAYRPHVKSWLGITLLFLVWALAQTGSLAQASEPPAGSEFRVFKDHPQANDFAMVTPEGSPLRLSDLKGSVVVLNFWRRDCHYCVMEKKRLKEMVQSLNRPDLKVVCVNFWDNPAEVRAYGRKNGGELTIAARPDGNRSVIENVVKGRLMGYYVLNEAGEAIYEVKGFPSSYVIDKEGRVVAGHMGLAHWGTSSVRDWISGLTGTKEREDVPAADQEELPKWIDRLLSASPAGTSVSGLKNGRRAQAGAMD